jgi:hypothetical protein
MRRVPAAPSARYRRTSDDTVPVVDSFAFPSAEDKAKIFNRNAARVFPGLAKVAR